MNKKNQVEIMGLVIIVILLAVAMIFVIQFTITGRPETIKTYTHEQIAEHMRTAVLQTTTSCYDLTILELLKRYAREDMGTCINGQDYKTFVKSEIEYLFNETLDKWQKSYNFTVDIPDYDNFGQSSGLCKGERSAAQPLPINVDGKLMIIKLYICG